MTANVHLLFESSVWQGSCLFPNSITFTFVWSLFFFFFLTSWDISVVSSLLSRVVLFYNALWVIFQPSRKSVLWTVVQIGKFSQAFWMILVFWKYTHTHTHAHSITIIFHIFTLNTITELMTYSKTHQLGSSCGMLITVRAIGMTELRFLFLWISICPHWYNFWSIWVGWVSNQYYNLHAHTAISGEGNGNLLQYSCLENPVDRGALWAAVHRVA